MVDPKVDGGPRPQKQRQPVHGGKQERVLPAAGEFVRAARLYNEMGAHFSEAWALLLAAEHGDLVQLEGARSFFARLDAKPFLARCDALLAASA